MRDFSAKGWAVLLVPITAEKTFEGSSVTDPQQPRELFGQEDHVRQYGLDYKERLEDSGFCVNVIYPADFLNEQEIEFMELQKRLEKFITVPRKQTEGNK